MTLPEDEYHFRGQRPGERVELFLRQHPFVLVEHALKTIVLLLLAILIMRWMGASTLSSIVAGTLVAVALIVVARSWYGWTNTMMLLTSQRVLFVEQRGFTSRKVSEALLENIQFVTHEVEGLIHTIFNFGVVKIQTAGAVEALLLSELVDPYEVQQRITTLRQKSGKGDGLINKQSTDKSDSAH